MASSGSEENRDDSGDIWWATTIALHPTSQTTNLTGATRCVPIEFGNVDYEGNMYESKPFVIHWKPVYVGSSDHLIQQGERMVISGPEEIPDDADSLTITGPGEYDSETGTPAANWVIQFNTENPGQILSATFFDSEESPLGDPVACCKPASTSATLNMFIN